MKVKLLKKVRERFSIIHMPDGYYDYDGRKVNGNLFCLHDTMCVPQNVYVQVGEYIIPGTKLVRNAVPDSRMFDTTTDAVNYLKDLIIDRIKYEYSKMLFYKHSDKTHKKIWPVN